MKKYKKLKKNGNNGKKIEKGEIKLTKKFKSNKKIKIKWLKK